MQGARGIAFKIVYAAAQVFNHYLVATINFCPVQCRVGPFYPFFDGIIWPAHCHTNAYRNNRAKEKLSCANLLRICSAKVTASKSGRRQDNNKFFAAPATGHVGCAYVCAQQPAKTAQNLVASKVTKLVIDLLELVQVQHPT